MFAKAAVIAAIVGAVGMASAQPAPVISGRTAAYVCPTSNTAGLALTAQVAATADVGTVAAADAFVCLYIGANAAALGLPLVGNSPLVPGGLNLGGVVNAAATVNACIYSKLTGALIGLGVQADANLCPVQASILVNKRRRHAIDRTSSFEHLD